MVRTRARPLGIEVKVGDPAAFDFAAEKVFGLLLQYPGHRWRAPGLRRPHRAAHAAGALVTVATDLLALTVLTPPGEFGADIAVGSAQRFGVPLGYGGPHAAFFATRDEFKRKMPGRIIGVSKDAHGNPALRMALQTREQHIRREKATSNICTAQVLLAVIRQHVRRLITARGASAGSPEADPWPHDAPGAGPQAARLTPSPTSAFFDTIRVYGTLPCPLRSGGGCRRRSRG